MRKPSRIIFVQNRLDDLGGVSRWCATISAELLERGYSVEIGGVVPAPDDERAGYYSDAIRTWTLSPGARPHPDDYGSFFGRNRFNRAESRFQHGVRNSARKILRGYGHDDLMIFTQIFARESFAPAFGDLEFRDRPRTIGQYHSSFSLATADGDRRRALDAYRNDDLFSCLTPEDAELFTRYGLNNSISVDNPVTLPGEASMAALEAPIAVSLSRYDSIKQVDHMVKAWALVHREAPEWQLHLYGSGPLEDELRQEIVDAGLEGSVRLMGPTDRPAEVLSNASISLNSSRHEGFGLALGEAALLGVPSVAYACSPGVEEVVRDGETGVVVPANDVSALAHGILSLIRDPQLRRQYGAAAREYVSERFGVQRVVDQWERVFENVYR